jgi:hypothetical protein
MAVKFVMLYKNSSVQQTAMRFVVSFLGQACPELAEESVRATQAVRAPHSSGERSAAATRFRGLGIHEDESLLHQRFLVVEDHSVQIDK